MCLVFLKTWPSVLWRCWSGSRKSIRPVKTEWWDTSVVICLERDANDLHMVQLMPLPPHHLLLQKKSEWFTSLVPAYPGCLSGKRPLNGHSSSVVVFLKKSFRLVLQQSVRKLTQNEVYWVTARNSIWPQIPLRIIKTCWRKQTDIHLMASFPGQPG